MSAVACRKSPHRYVVFVVVTSVLVKLMSKFGNRQENLRGSIGHRYMFVAVLCLVFSVSRGSLFSRL